MNERIKKLALQAGLLSARVEGTKTRVLLATVPETNGEIADPDTQLGKFAELIVRECAQVAFEGDLKRAIGQWGSHSDILKHFEVEHDVVKTFRS